MITANPHIDAMAPYALARMQAPSGKRLVSLAQNESLRPPSPLATAAAGDALANMQGYPDPDWRELATALADHHGIPRERILCGAGSLDLIGCLARVFAGAGRSVLAPRHAYPFFRSAAEIAGARFDTAPEQGVTASVDALLDAVRPDTGLVFIANPGNPTGTRIPSADLRRLREGLRTDILLVIDEAYGEFADHLDDPSIDPTDRDDTVLLRTFSKAYGLASARVGWGVFPEPLAGQMRKAMNPNNIPAASQAAAAAALRDQDYMRETCRMVSAARAEAATRLSACGITVSESFTNFLLLDFGKPERAATVDALLRSEGIFLRGQAGVGLPQMLRMTIGPARDVAAAITVLERWSTEVTP